MVKTLMRGFSVFAVLLISGALMKLFGEPLIDLIPSGTWGLEWLASAVLWLITIDALFWILAAGVAFLAFVLIRSRLLELLSSVVVGVSVAGGVIGGAAYRLNNLASPVANAATDPALWILALGVIAPIVVWAAKWGAEELLWRWKQERELKRTTVGTKPAPEVSP